MDAVRSLEAERNLIDAFYLCDNNSTDETRELLQEAEENNEIIWIRQSENLGFAGGFNYLFEQVLKQSVAEYFLILNNDTEAEPGFLQELLNEAAPDRVVSPMILWHKDRRTVIQCAGNFDREWIKMKNLFAGKNRDDVPVKTVQVEQTDGCCFMIHRKWLEKNIRFDPDLFIYFEDVDLFFRLTEAGLGFYYVPSSVLLHKEYGSSGGRDTVSPFRNYYFWRNRLIIASRIHSFPARLRILYRILRLALAKKKEDLVKSKRAGRAIGLAIKDFFTGRRGRRDDL